ncbi:MAG: anti-sigma regulatory factor [Bacteroidetes bacterium GWF2_42_66]|nr:MAG: anti-sigma regulatory factor [Bacteroidetes bacterium GWA2_42_15]OFX99451.1 MAG: anti-sigma regulatory factor [Bacteroidetes bacterium GWE2_42_39]OFY46982.1 MAG: anti-sigma regulatory factor [Bacteroidetes bacterium GWF2_42_66]HBL76869.1 anti-sigma regulatory factor [Prolixibacteraceae bacterium]HCR90503.1 anti-sigma regulatory factor [Prolixibacteraceae bacterium]
MRLSFKIEGGDFTQAGQASSEVKKVLKQLGIDAKTIKNIVIALYEAEVNIVAHAYRGTIDVEIDDKKITIRLTDEGPGIPDIEMAMKEGFSTASKKVREMGFGAGMGLPNIKKNTDLMDIKSTVGVGTELIMVNYF